MKKKCDLLKEIYQSSFSLDDIVLYLDTHPHDIKALQLYQHYADIRKKSMMEYENVFGPLLNDRVKDCDYWSWVKEPWPWEGEEL